MKYSGLITATAALMLSTASIAQADAITLKPGKQANMVLLSKFLGILVFDQANEIEQPHVWKFC